ncbi:YicC/YloC family endoribonuclease [Roseobacter sinensis]|uniref:YicC family protein n=1 Tax=Roseobacter sinensis TaxID=2931391 RepID=A0ABT3BBA3_9RHOB|nr:YicC/YloC family endoribonuclease [Roseobacter sp. WL0113]MCV3270835.1 YicC family protein [Roseobacter sp. WL0113]
MIRSMTGFASASGSLPPHAWDWELRAVNGKGLDLRLRLPDWIDGLEAGLRKLLSAEVKRGNLTLSLRLARDEQSGAMRVNEAQLASVLEAMAVIEGRADAAGVRLAPASAADIVTLRGVLEQAATEDDAGPLAAALMTEAEALLADFNEMRVGEGAALRKLLLAQLDEIAALTAEAARLADARGATLAETLKRNLAKVMENTDAADPDRVAQELALIAVKSDVTEEIDRLAAHVEAARDLIAEGGPVGRKLDFLMQEFNREANTLCAKAQNTELTRCGLALKTVIDQMREQVQNVE